MAIAAIVGIALVGVVISFQVALALGAPWGAAAWGGQQPGRLPARLRIASVGAALMLIFLAWVVAATSGLTGASPVPQSWLVPATWAAAGYFALGAVVNLIARSRIERLWGPVSLVIAVCCAIVAVA